MTKPLVSNELWEVIEPLLLPERPKPKGGRPRVADRAALAGIIFVLKTCHCKSIFDKVGVRTRRELVAHLFERHFRP